MHSLSGTSRPDGHTTWFSSPSNGLVFQGRHYGAVWCSAPRPQPALTHRAAGLDCWAGAAPDRFPSQPSPQDELSPHDTKPLLHSPPGAVQPMLSPLSTLRHLCTSSWTHQTAPLNPKNPSYGLSEQSSVQGLL